MIMVCREEKRLTKIESHFDEIVSTLGLDLKDDSLIDTPKRVAKMYVNEIFWGLITILFPRLLLLKIKCSITKWL